MRGVLLAVALCVTTCNAQQYRVDLGPGNQSWYALNDLGELVGAVREGPNNTATIRYRNGEVERLNIAGNNNSPIQISNRGVVIGDHSDGETDLNTYIFDQDSILIPLKSPTDLNDRGEVIGGTFVGNAHSGGLWRNGVVTGVAPQFSDLGFFRAINNNTEVVGFETDREFGRYIPTYWTEETGTIRLGDNNTANDINDSGFIVGDQSVWLRGQFHHALEGTGLFINNSNHVLGVRQSGWTIWRDNGPEDLESLYNDPRWRIAWLNDFNNRGQILAEAWYMGSTQVQSIILTPVPEPATLVGLAFPAICLMRRRAITKA